MGSAANAKQVIVPIESDPHRNRETSRGLRIAQHFGINFSTSCACERGPSGGWGLHEGAHFTAVNPYVAGDIAALRMNYV